jgi:hypothetical protein
MSEREVIARTREPINVMTLVTLEACGLGVGQTVLVHTRLSVFRLGRGRRASSDLGSPPGARPDRDPGDADPDVEESSIRQRCAWAGARSVMAQNAQKRINPASI